ncbi:hypothetical protein GE107_25200 [Cohnella sp. CFH 77786]|uniref:hypothetical protein n=1 Tax=Cohnella sp. CFH 77786 TaxID=2662265 RepID=UPI001C60C3AC|nr:hypothetical protein [Cohnella sp. CFH 77786]MBW5449327.1 hypothetical protein [Cohnella sp. CFH 77786]
MKELNPETHYTVDELATITGIDYTRFYSYKDLLRLDLFTMPSGRTGYGIEHRAFEDALNALKTYEFEIPAFAEYRERKRPFRRQFFSAREVTRFMELIGDSRSIFTIKRYIRETKMPSYVFERKYIVPINYLVELYQLPVNEELNQVIGEVLADPSYEYCA